MLGRRSPPARLTLIRELDQPRELVLAQYVRDGLKFLVSISRADVDDFVGAPLPPSDQNFLIERDLETLEPIISGKFERAETAQHVDRRTGRTLPLIELARADLNQGLRHQSFNTVPINLSVPQGIPAAHALADEGTMEHWFTKQPREVSVTFAARAALRVLPLVARSWGRREQIAAGMLPIFRAVQAAWSAAKYPTRRDVITDAARAAVFPPTDGTSDASQTVAFAAAAAIPTAAANSAEFAARANGAAARANAALADPALEEVMVIEAIGDREARASFAAQILAGEKLWPQGTPGWVENTWIELKAVLLETGDDWDVWIDWYEDRLAGRLGLGENFDVAVAMLADKLWAQGPKAINPVIRRLIDAHTPPAAIPAQGAGPHFGLGTDHKIALAAPEELDETGNNLLRLSQLLPQLRRAADRLVGHLGSTNAHPELTEDASAYRAAIDGEAKDIAWGLVFGLGVMLDNTAAAAERDVDRMAPALEDAPLAALKSVLTLHGALILETADGRELMEQADRMRLTRVEHARLQEDAQTLARALKKDEEVIQPKASDIISKAAEAIGEGPHPERATIFGIATVKNAAVILVSAAAVSAAGATEVARRET